MKQEKEQTQIFYAVLRGRANQQLFEEEIQKMKILDVAAGVQKAENDQVQILAYCVLDNELHLMMQAENDHTADVYLEAVARRFEERCFYEGREPLRVDYLPDVKHFPKVNTSVSERGFLYGSNPANIPKCSRFRKHTIRELHAGSVLGCCLKLHMMPVRRGIVSNPEDYWWCSYLDYFGRQWLPLTNTGRFLAMVNENPKQAMKIMRRKHYDALQKLPSND